MTPSTSRNRNDGLANSGNPAGIAPTIATPFSSRLKSETLKIAAATTNNATGRPGNSLLPSTNKASAASPSISTTQVRAAKLTEKNPGTLKEMFAATGDSKQFWQLGERNRQVRRRP